MHEAKIKTAEEIEVMREAGKILNSILQDIRKAIKPNIDVWKLEELFLLLCKKHNVTPGCKGYIRKGTSNVPRLPPFPTGLCVSINEQSVHCFPKKGVILKSSDIMSVDTVIKHKDLFVDSAFAVCVGNAPEVKQRLVETSEKALYEAISKVKHNVKIGKISHALQKTVEGEGFNVLKDYAGHGIGHSMHEEPEVLCYGEKNDGPKLKEGMTICIESLVCSGSDIVENIGGWETKMKDGFFCMFEHTILVTKKGCEILT